MESEVREAGEAGVLLEEITSGGPEFSVGTLEVIGRVVVG